MTPFDPETASKEELTDQLKKARVEISLFKDAYFQLEETKKRLGRLERTYRSILEHIPVVAYSASPRSAGEALYITPRVEEWTGHTPEEVYDDPDIFFHIVHGDDAERVRQTFEKAYEDEESYRFEYRVVNKDTGETHHIRDIGGPVTEKGQVIRYDGVMVDISEEVELRRLAEEKIQELERFVHLTVGREMKMMEMKKKLREVEEEEGGVNKDPGDGEAD